MIIAYLIMPQDDDSYMLGEETYRQASPAKYHDWRFGRDGIPHPATCPTCGRKIDLDFVNPEFRANHRNWDIGVTYDGYDIVSKALRDYCRSNDWQGITFVPLPADPDFFVVRLTRVLRFDADRRGTRFEKLCPSCGKYNSVAGATPVYLRDIKEPIADGFFRTDVEFGSAHEQGPLMLVGVRTAEQLRKKGFRNCDLEPIND